ncbi:MAG: metalloregulator ArsR/SmtB family transcription factor [Actinomycetota bacterium]
MDERRVPDDHVACAVDTLALLASASRLRIIHALLHESPLAVGVLADLADLSLSATSQHLNRMRRAGVLKATKDGVNVLYELADDRFVNLADAAFWYAEHMVDSDHHHHHDDDHRRHQIPDRAPPRP